MRIAVVCLEGVAMRMLLRHLRSRAWPGNALSRGCGLGGFGTGLSGDQESIHVGILGTLVPGSLMVKFSEINALHRELMILAS